MQIAVFNTQLTMTSREIAGLTGKQHGHVRRDIENMLEELSLLTDGCIQFWTDPQNGKTYPEYALDRELTETLLTGYSAILRRKVIARWRELESKQTHTIPQTMAQALRLAADQQDQIEAQLLLLEQQKPAVEFVDRFVEAKSAKGFREVAKILGVKEREFIASLALDKIIFKQGSNWLPYAELTPRYFSVKTGEANGHAFIQTRFTPEGIAWVAKRHSQAA